MPGCGTKKMMKGGKLHGPSSMMEKKMGKGMAKADMQKKMAKPKPFAKGGMMRGAGCATKGKKFSGPMG